MNLNQLMVKVNNWVENYTTNTALTHVEAHTIALKGRNQLSNEEHTVLESILFSRVMRFKGFEVDKTL